MVFVERHRSILEHIPRIGDQFPKAKPTIIYVLGTLTFGLLFLPRGFHFIINEILFKPGTNDGGVLYGKNEPVQNGLTINLANPEAALETVADIFNRKSDHASTNALLEPAVAVAAVQENNQNIKEFLPHRTHRTTVYLLLYCFAFFICSFFLSKIAKLFLDVFIFKANPIMYFFIILGIIQWGGDIEQINLIFSDTKTERLPSIDMLLKFQSVLFWIYLIIHIMVVFVFLTPIAQGIFTIYLLTLFVNFGVFNKIKNKEGIQMYTVQSDLEGYLPNSTDTNSFFHKFIFKNNSLMFSFILTIFFLCKCLTTFIPWFMLQNRELRYSFFVLNFLFLLICCELYKSYFKGEEPFQMFSFNRPPPNTGNGVGHTGNGFGFSDLATFFSPNIKSSFDNGV